jgi:hypothetical protein
VLRGGWRADVALLDPGLFHAVSDLALRGSPTGEVVGYRE